jgi:hypothetical protein
MSGSAGIVVKKGVDGRNSDQGLQDEEQPERKDGSAPLGLSENLYGKHLFHNERFV